VPRVRRGGRGWHLGGAQHGARLRLLSGWPTGPRSVPRHPDTTLWWTRNYRGEGRGGAPFASGHGCRIQAVHPVHEQRWRRRLLEITAPPHLPRHRRLEHPTRARVRGRGDPGPVRTGSDRAMRYYPRSTF
jgi:hypothetical protein